MDIQASFSSQMVDKWLSNLSESTRKGSRTGLLQFETWLKGKGFSGLEDAVAFQKQALGDDRYKIVDLLKEYV